ncbi:hypothetical protein I4U23_012834 [Adineta vaga]|nr:hypothetical protein I4U23_012834 [Adineta vaga]
MNMNYLRTQKGLIHLSRLFLLSISIIYINILSCGQNAFGGHANVNSTSDSEFIHIIMWVALAIDGFIFLCRIFEQDDGTIETSLLIDAALNVNTLFCNNKYKCYVHSLPTITSLALTILYMYDDVQRCIQKLNSF